MVSLPIVVPTSVPARNNPGYDNLGGYSPVLIELSDVLPWQAFAPRIRKSNPIVYRSECLSSTDIPTCFSLVRQRGKTLGNLWEIVENFFVKST
ncbi:MAG: hypothetical protein ACLR1T_07285, partial [Evtepia gabavorous]